MLRAIVSQLMFPTSFVNSCTLTPITPLLIGGIHEALQALNENQADTPQEKPCPSGGGATNPNTPDPNDNENYGNLKTVSKQKLNDDKIDAHSFKEDIVGKGSGGNYNISVDPKGNVYLTPRFPGGGANVPTGYNYPSLMDSYPLLTP